MVILLGMTANEAGRANMAKQVTCDCGFMLRTPSDDELVKHVQLHAKDTHSLDLTPEQALARRSPWKPQYKLSDSEDPAVNFPLCFAFSASKPFDSKSDSALERLPG